MANENGGSVVTESDIQRIGADQAALTEKGFALAPELFAVGTPLYDIGVSNAARHRADFEALPPAEDACADLIARVRDEHREDFTVPALDLRMLPTGALSACEGGVLDVEEAAFRQLAAWLTPGGAGYLSECPPALRAQNINHWTQNADPEAEVMLRTRNGHDPRRLWSVVGPRYGRFDADEVARTVARVAGPGARADILYDGRRTRIDLWYASTVAAQSQAVGEVFRVGLRVTTADDGTQAVETRAVAERLRCRNASVIRAETGVTRRTHRGEGLGMSIARAVEAAHGAIAGFGERWAAAERDAVIEAALGEKGIAAAFETLLAKRLIAVPGTDRTAALAGLMGAWNVEPGYNRTAVVNAVTRYAHEGAFANPWASEALEEQVGALLYARRLDLSAVSV